MKIDQTPLAEYTLTWDEIKDRPNLYEFKWGSAQNGKLYVWVFQDADYVYNRISIGIQAILKCDYYRVITKDDGWRDCKYQISRDRVVISN